MLGIPGHPDYARAWDGLQVEGPAEITKVTAAVDASEATIREAAARGADLRPVRHGLFWDGGLPVTGRRYRKLRALLEHGMALCSAHLPLDGHPDVGNSALLARALGLAPAGRFGEFEGVPIGWWGTLDEPVGVERLASRRRSGGPVHVVAGGPALAEKVAVVTGGAGSCLAEAAAVGLDAHAAYVGERFGLEWGFVDLPTGL